MHIRVYKTLKEDNFFLTGQIIFKLKKKMRERLKVITLIFLEAGRMSASTN
jgi:hypothetical protein